MLLSRFVVGILPVGLIMLGADVVSGQDYPNKPIRIITAGSGGGLDFTSRLIAQGISGPLGQPVIVDNRVSSQLGEIASKAAPDGYTLLVAGDSLPIFPLLYKASFDVMRDFSPISLLLRDVRVLAVHPSLPVKSVKDLIALAKAKPGELNYSSSTPGGQAHLAAELFKFMTNVNIVNVPYKNGTQGVTALLGGEVQLTFSDAISMAPHTKSGKLRALAVTSAEPSPLAPGLPTVAAAVPGYEMVGQTSLYAPAKTPVTIISQLNREVVRVLNQADVKERFLKNGVETVGSSPDVLAATIQSEVTRVGKVIKAIGLRLD